MAARLPDDETPRRRGRPPKAPKGGGQSRKKEGGEDLEGGLEGLEEHEGSPLLSSPIVDHPPATRPPSLLNGVPALVLDSPAPGESLESYMSRVESQLLEWSMKIISDPNAPDGLRALAYSKTMDLAIAGRKGKLAAAGKAVAKVVGDREQALMDAAKGIQRMSDAELMQVVEGGYSDA